LKVLELQTEKLAEEIVAMYETELKLKVSNHLLCPGKFCCLCLFYLPLALVLLSTSVCILQWLLASEFRALVYPRSQPVVNFENIEGCDQFRSFSGTASRSGLPDLLAKSEFISLDWNQVGDILKAPSKEEVQRGTYQVNSRAWFLMSLRATKACHMLPPSQNKTGVPKPKWSGCTGFILREGIILIQPLSAQAKYRKYTLETNSNL